MKRHQLKGIPTTAVRIVRRDAHTLAEWADLARRNPNAVPLVVQKTLENRGYIRREE